MNIKIVKLDKQIVKLDKQIVLDIEIVKLNIQIVELDTQIVKRDIIFHFYFYSIPASSCTVLSFIVSLLSFQFA